jgi:hypothetical protein
METSLDKASENTSKGLVGDDEGGFFICSRLALFSMGLKESLSRKPPGKFLN